MKEEVLRESIRNEIKKNLANHAFGEEFDYMLMEATLDEDIGGFLDTVGGGIGSVFSFVEDNVGEALTDSFKQFLFTKVFEYLEEVGLPISPESVFGRAIINVLEELQWTKLGTYLDDDGCIDLTNDIIKGLQEGLIQETVMDEIAELFFGQGARVEGFVGSPMRELINIKLQEMTESLRKPFLDFICKNRDLGQLASDLKAAAFSSGFEGSLPSAIDDLNLPKLSVRD